MQNRDTESFTKFIKYVLVHVSIDEYMKKVILTMHGIGSSIVLSSSHFVLGLAVVVVQDAGIPVRDL